MIVAFLKELLTRLAVASCIFALCSLTLGAQTGPVERTFHVPKSKLEKTLKQLQAYTGAKLPTLEGFAASDGKSLDHYQRGYYQYSLQITPVSANESRLHVTAKITAWYAGSSPTSSGYKELPSNGRLESDLLDRLQEALGGHAAAKEDAAAEAAVQSATARLPDAPSLSGSSAFKNPKWSVHGLPSKEPAEKGNSETPRIEDLRQQEKTFEQVLEHQTHPDNLAAVKDSHTPIFARPDTNADTVLMADAEDEFQILDSNEYWVHVQISGLSRGWVQRVQVEMPESTNGAAKAEAQDTTDRDAVGTADMDRPFRQTREETSLFPGDWDALKGKKVRIIWVQPVGKESENSGDASRSSFARSVFKNEYPKLTQDNADVAGVVVVFDSQDGGMAATTMATLQQWQAGHLSDSAFWKRCWLDPTEAFKE